MFSSSGIVPSRFLLLTSHTVLIIVILFARDSNVRSCIPVQYSQDEYTLKDNQLIIGLSVALGCVALEFFSFIFGVSTFIYMQNLISIAAHSSASIALAYFVMSVFPCDTYWYIFGFCSAFPAVTEIITIISVMCCGQGFY